MALEQRKAELAPMVEPFHGSEIDRVALALADMFAAFRSMRQTGSEIVALVDAAARALAEFPAWAIEKACRGIQMNGVWRNGAFDRQWPPNDAEIVKEVRDRVSMYGDQHRSACELLAADVEQHEGRGA